MGYFLAGMIMVVLFTSMLGGCAQIGFPTGGERDSLPPVLVKASPPNGSVNFRGNKITLSFDEYVLLKDIVNNVYISPYQAYNPVITSNLRTITVKLKDSLQANTTYSISFGNGIQDVNENNTLRNFTYVFSTGPVIDSLNLSGKVILAETGNVDSTYMVLVYKNPADSTVKKIKPAYLSRINGQGEFSVSNLPPGRYGIYALKDGDNSKTYNSLSEGFAFMDSLVVLPAQQKAVLLYAYVEKKSNPITPAGTRAVADRKFRYRLNLEDSLQDLNSPLTIAFNRKLTYLHEDLLKLYDSSNSSLSLPAGTTDSTGQTLSLNVKWIAGNRYTLIIPANVAADSTGANLSKSDTIHFMVRPVEDYGNVVLRFTNLDLARHPVLQVLEGDNLRYSYPLTSSIFTKKLFQPGNYDLRILYDDNQNGLWDTGHYNLRLQPEKVVSLSQKLQVKANWDNERDIILE